MIYTGSSALKTAMWNISTLSQSIVRIKPPYDLRQQIEQIQQIPLLSSSCTRLIQLLAADEIDLDQFVEVVETDPFLCLQVFKAANSAIYSYNGELKTLREAIVRVVGLDKAVSIALGLATVNAIQCQKNGVLGLKSYWRHAMLCAELLMTIERYCPPENAINKVEAHLAGLFHDIGFPLLGHFFPEIHRQLDQMIGSNPSVPELAIEKFSLGVTHCDLGFWLVKAWNLPEAVSTAILNHHDSHYRGDHWRINLMIGLADRLLQSVETGIADVSKLEADLYEPLGLGREQIETIANHIPGIVASTAELAHEYFKD
jgi:HD-like signal output (HDOD) protein